MVDISPGQVVQLSSKVRRITAPNPGPMTGAGTNTYLIGSDNIAVVDPGPADPLHIKTILEACEGRLKWILVTHTHRDHSPAAKALAEATGALMMGNTLAEDDGFQDVDFRPHKSFIHDECFATDEFKIRVIHTPGHVDNHLCYLVEDDGLLITGDHIMQGSTVVIIPPYGDMQDYIASLSLLLNYPLKSLAPGHGSLIDTPVQEIQRLIAHRLGREEKVLHVLADLAVATIDALTPGVYDDVDPKLHPIAKYSLRAHLIKLEKEGRVSLHKDSWTLLGAAS